MFVNNDCGMSLNVDQLTHHLLSLDYWGNKELGNWE